MVKKVKNSDKVEVSIGENIDPSSYLLNVSLGASGRSSLASKLAGKIISLNLKKETYFGISNIWLTPERYWATVPDNLSDQDYAIIAKSLEHNKLVLGKTYIPPIDKVSNICEKYWELLSKSGFDSKDTKAAFSTLVRKGQDSGWTAVEIAQFCLEKEQKARKREGVVKLLTQLIKSYDGPIQLWDPPEESEGIKKVIVKSDGSLEAITNSGKKVAKQMQTPPPPNHVGGSKTADEAINDLLK